jgi:L-threonylcarbamoyladenylate synthase
VSAPVGTDIAAAAAVLRAGGLVAFPTETVYGLGADASNGDAVAKIFAAKGRPTGHPLIVHLPATARLDDWAIAVPEAARRLVARAWPGPLTVILERSARVADAVTGGAPTVGLRVPSHPMALALLDELGRGIAAPSANRFGGVSPTCAAHVIDDGIAIDYILDGGACDVGVESTIVDLSRGRPVLLRPGGFTREAIEAIVGPLAAPDDAAPAAPGTLASHYAPRALVIAVSPDEVPAAIATTPGALAVLAQASAFAAWGPLPGVVKLPLADNPVDMAAALYGALRTLDRMGVDVVIAALPPAAGLGEAVGDRLRRAAGPRRDPT